jgi:restriction system protein
VRISGKTNRYTYYWNEIRNIIDDIAEKNIPQTITIDSNTTGEEFEAICAGFLQKAGWDVSQTPKSGDQGVDIIAKQNGIDVAIQCKRYSGTVGNTAVQEIIAGKMFYKTQFAAVVSNSNYTKSAINLANNTDVFLLHYSELSSLYEILSP